MPIRIKRDDNQESYSPRSGGGGTGGGGGGGLMQFIPLLIGLFGRNPKLLLIIAVIGGGYMLFSKGCGGLSGGDPTAQSGGLATGANFDIQKYASTEIYEPLADNKRNPMPERVSLLEYAPTRRNQGQQGSCVAWASAYGARSIMEARESGQNPNQSTFSPAFLYNLIALEGCQGAYLPEALKVMQNKGLAPFDAMRYNENDCSTRPDQMSLKKAEDFKIDG